MQCQANCGENCRCGVVSIPEPEAEEAPVCENCGEPEEDGCECVVCGRCDERVGTDSICSNCERCSDCCSSRGDCWNCEGCDERVSSDQCSCCDCCESCCECSSCECCGSRVYPGDFCGNCERCLDCCNCNNSERAVELLEPRNKFHAANRKQHLINPSKRFISAEIEVSESVSGDRIYRVCKQWGAGIVEDGSLPDSGFEVNTAPASGDQFVNQIAEICGALSASGAEVNSNCGLHVHVDARDFSWWEVRKLIRLYALIEKALFALVPHSRRSSSYCLRCGSDYLQYLTTGFRPKECKKAILKAVYKEEPSPRTANKRQSKYESARYAALNLHSWLYRGTIECRLFNGTVSAEKITNWGLLWSGILDWAYRATEKQIDSLDGRESLSILLEICPTEAVRAWVQSRFNKYGY